MWKTSIRISLSACCLALVSFGCSDTSISFDDAAACGNGKIEAAEVCDGDAIGEATCLSETGFETGTLRCNDECTAYVTDECHTCGNDAVEGPEVCDGAELDDATCSSLESGEHGTVACNTTCDDYVTDDCHGCGNGTREADEECDGEDFGGDDCSSVPGGFAPGALKCDSECKVETTECTLCGNGVIDEGEQCDGEALNDTECSSLPGDLGFMGGDLSCDTATCEFVTSECHKCGNGEEDTDLGEECDDGDSIDGNDCTNACLDAACGDGIVWSEGAGDEECDLGDNNSDTAADTCRTDCRDAHCGDGVLDASETCEPGSPFSDNCCSPISCGWTVEFGADPQGVCTAMSGDIVYFCGGGGTECIAIPEEQQEPTTKMDGLPSEIQDVYDPVCGDPDGICPADPTSGVRALLGFPIRNEALLAEHIKRMYDPIDPAFRQYLTPDEWNAEYAPLQEDFDLVAAWLASTGLSVNYEASNRLLIQFSGTVEQFNTAFSTTLLEFERRNPQGGNDPFIVYGTEGRFTVPLYVAERTNGVITADTPADTKPLPGEAGDITVEALGNSDRTLQYYREAYGAQEIYEAGNKGQGVTLGVVVGATYKQKDLQSFWRSMGLCVDGVDEPECLDNAEGFLRENPQRHQIMEPVATRFKETNIDIEWAGGIAPKSDLVIYEGPDSHNTSMVFTWNEAIARGEASVLTSSFAHRENSEPKPVRHQYSASAMMGASLGITLVAASGDSGMPDTPSSSPYVTAVGGTRLSRSGDVFTDVVWNSGGRWGTGCGVTRSFVMPYWQEGIAEIENDPRNPLIGEEGAQYRRRAVVDVAVSATSFPVVVSWSGCVASEGSWCHWGGTSFSAPVFAGLVALVNSQRIAEGKPVVGYLNPALYLDADVRATFRDVTVGEVDFTDDGTTYWYSAKSGWDYPSGWGAPNTAALANELP